MAKFEIMQDDDKKKLDEYDEVFDVIDQMMKRLDTLMDKMDIPDFLKEDNSKDSDEDD